MSHMSNMSSLAACSVTDTKPMQFPLAQRRKRRVLFTQAQVSNLLPFQATFSLSISALGDKRSDSSLRQRKSKERPQQKRKKKSKNVLNLLD